MDLIRESYLAAYTSYVRTCMEAGLVDPPFNYEEWNRAGKPKKFADRHQPYEAECLKCGKKFISAIAPGQIRKLPKFCSEEHRIFYYLEHLHPNDKEAYEKYKRKAEKLHIIPAPVTSNNDEYVAETYGPAPKKEDKPASKYQQRRLAEKQAYEERKKRRNQQLLDFRCPTPFKQMFRTLEEAQRFIDTVHPDEKMLEPYQCKCGSVHFGHKKHAPGKEDDTRMFSIPDPDRTWCAHPNLHAYATVEDAEGFMAARVSEEVLEMGVSVKPCSCGNFHLKFPYEARKKDRQLKKKSYAQEHDKRY